VRGEGAVQPQGTTRDKNVMAHENNIAHSGVLVKRPLKETSRKAVNSRKIRERKSRLGLERQGPTGC